MNIALEAFGDTDFSWVRPLESIWRDTDPAIAGPHDALEDQIVKDLIRQTKDPARKPPGLVLIGQAGVGKTHLIGNLRRKVWQSGGLFIVLDVIGIRDFWASAALSFVTSLIQRMPDNRQQAAAVLNGVAKHLDRRDKGEPTEIDFTRLMQYQDVLLALSLLKRSDAPWHDAATFNVVHAWLQGFEIDEEKRRALGIMRPPPAPIELVRGMSWLMSTAGPTLVAVDQIDGVINAGSVSIPAQEFGAERTLTDVLSAGLLQLYEALTRSQTVVTCLPDSWKELEKGLQPAIDRFRTPPAALIGMSHTTAIGELIESRLAPAYKAANFSPPFPTWPFTPAAIGSAVGMLPRHILMACDRHQRRCLADDEVILSESFVTQETSFAPPPKMHKNFDESYRVSQSTARLDGLLDDKDDGNVGRLLRDIFDLYASHIEPRDNLDVVSKGDAAQRSPPLHGRLTFTFHDEKDREHHICFRAIEHANANAYSARLKAAVTAAGIATSIPGRDLLIIRRGPVPSGRQTRQLHESFLSAGGKVINPTDDDLKRFVALRDMREAAIADGTLASFESWLLERQPLCGTVFFKAAGLCPPPGVSHRAAPQPASPPISPETTAAAPPRPAEHAAAAIPVGHRIAGNDPVSVPTKVLPRHTAIIAGAGSGKTVLLRRLVEEAALAGIPAIVVDPNNDLSRLGDAWPERPAGFTDDDAAKAARYHAGTDVVIWTPGIQAGNPLFLSVLPDFAAIGADPDEREQAVSMAADTLAPLGGAKANLARGVLSDALRHFASKGGGTLKDLTALLADLPEGISDIGNAEKLAGKMADELKASVATNPLLKADGPVLDPKLLFFGEDPARTRISVINLSGLASDDAKQDFVNRLQMTLFGWIKRHPSPRGMLYVIDEAQTFIPSGSGALSKTSGVQLVAQARKYGLGMIVVTQAPKGIDNKVVSNCTTQFLGKQNAPATIDAARELIAAGGGRADDFGKLGTGEFYFKTDGSGKPFKVRTPICLRITRQTRRRRTRSWHGRGYRPPLRAMPPCSERLAAHIFVPIS